MTIGAGAALGALYDPTAGQTNDSAVGANGGALCSGIGIGWASIYETYGLAGDNEAASGLPGFPDDTALTLERIGSGATIVPLDTSLDASLNFIQAAAQLVDGAQDGVTGFYNHTGATVESGEWFWAVEAA